jgi:2-C-methyl-D-erythritol 4-phosphate cytidylyltransferase
MTAVLGVVPTVGRSQFCGLKLAGEPLFVHACRTLAGIPGVRTSLVASDGAAPRLTGLSDVEVVGLGDVERRLRFVGDGIVVVHDPLCPLTPAGWVRSMLERAESGGVLVAVRPVVDTLKSTRDEIVTGTVDRTELQVLSSPIVAPVAMLVDDPEVIPLLADPVALVERLRARYDVELVEAPSAAQRVDDPAGVELLAAATPSSRSDTYSPRSDTYSRRAGSERREPVSDEHPRVAVVLLAAGSGSRVAQGVNKVFLPVAGRPMVSWSLVEAAQVQGVAQVVIVIAERDRELAEHVLAAERVNCDARTVVGGKTRHESEWRALQELAPDLTGGRLDVVVVHDTARPLTESLLFEQVIACAHRHGGAVPIRPATALIGLDKSPCDVVAAQTPQAFRAAELLRSYELAQEAGFIGTDTASCVERFSDLEIHCLPGSASNIKITFPDDLRLAERRLTARG